MQPTTPSETPTEPRLGALRYFFLTLLAAIFVPAVIVSIPTLFLLIFWFPITIIAAPALIGIGFLLPWMYKTVLPQIRTAAKEDRLPKNGLILYSPFFLPLFYVLVITSIGFSGDWEEMRTRIDFFCYALAVPYFFIVTPATFFAIFGSGVEIIPIVPLTMTFATAVVGIAWLLRHSPRKNQHIPVVAGFTLLSVVLGVVAFQYRQQMREYSLSSDYSVDRVRDERYQPAWTDEADETDLKPYIPFSADNKLKSVERPVDLSIGSNHPSLHGALALYPVYAAAAQAIYKNVSTEQAAEIVRGGTSPAAFASLMGGSADMVFMLRPSEKQENEAKNLGKTLSVTPIGREAFVFFVSNTNPVDGLSSQQIRDIYSKQITRWSELGGRNEKILPFQRPEGSGSQTAMQRFMGTQPLAKPVREEYQELMGGIVNRVADYRNYGHSIGYSFRYYVEGMFKHEGVKLLAVNGIEPSPENIRNGSYPLVGEMVIVTAGTENPNVPKLIDWFLSPQGQKLTEQVGYVSLSNSLISALQESKGL